MQALAAAPRCLKIRSPCATSATKHSYQPSGYAETAAAPSSASQAVPTHDETRAFLRDYEGLTHQQQDRFDNKREEFVTDLVAMEQGALQRFRPGLRVKRVQGESSLFEMAWAPDGRAIFSMGEPVMEGKRHIVWHRVGDHSILP